MQKVKINTEFITLGQFLKMNNFISSGGAAKFFLVENQVFVNNEAETRRGRKLYPNMVVKLGNREFIITND